MDTVTMTARELPPSMPEHQRAPEAATAAAQDLLDSVSPASPCCTMDLLPQLASPPPLASLCTTTPPRLHDAATATTTQKRQWHSRSGSPPESNTSSTCSSGDGHHNLNKKSSSSSRRPSAAKKSKPCDSPARPWVPLAWRNRTGPASSSRALQRRSHSNTGVVIPLPFMASLPCVAEQQGGATGQEELLPQGPLLPSASHDEEEAELVAAAAHKPLTPPRLPPRLSTRASVGQDDETDWSPPDHLRRFWHEGALQRQLASSTTGAAGGGLLSSLYYSKVSSACQPQVSSSSVLQPGPPRRVTSPTTYSSQESSSTMAQQGSLPSSVSERAHGDDDDHDLDPQDEAAPATTLAWSGAPQLQEPVLNDPQEQQDCEEEEEEEDDCDDDLEDDDADSVQAIARERTRHTAPPPSVVASITHGLNQVHLDQEEEYETHPPALLLPPASLSESQYHNHEPSRLAVIYHHQDKEEEEDYEEEDDEEDCDSVHAVSTRRTAPRTPSPPSVTLSLQTQPLKPAAASSKYLLPMKAPTAGKKKSPSPPSISRRPLTVPKGPRLRLEAKYGSKKQSQQQQHSPPPLTHKPAVVRRRPVTTYSSKAAPPPSIPTMHDCHTKYEYTTKEDDDTATTAATTICSKTSAAWSLSSSGSSSAFSRSSSGRSTTSASASSSFMSVPSASRIPHRRPYLWSTESAHSTPPKTKQQQQHSSLLPKPTRRALTVPKAPKLQLEAKYGASKHAASTRGGGGGATHKPVS